MRDWDGKDKELVIVPLPDVPPSELRPAVAMQDVSVSSLHEVALPQLSLPPQPQRSLPPHSPRSRPRPTPRHRPSPSPKPNQVPVGGGEKLRALLAARDLTRRGPHPRPDRSPVGLSLSLTRTQTLSEPFPYAWP